jgi:hypothetical protein
MTSRMDSGHRTPSKIGLAELARDWKRWKGLKLTRSRRVAAESDMVNLSRNDPDAQLPRSPAASFRSLGLRGRPVLRARAFPATGPPKEKPALARCGRGLSVHFVKIKSRRISDVEAHASRG